MTQILYLILIADPDDCHCHLPSDVPRMVGACSVSDSLQLDPTSHLRTRFEPDDWYPNCRLSDEPRKYKFKFRSEIQPFDEMRNSNDRIWIFIFHLVVIQLVRPVPYYQHLNSGPVFKWWSEYWSYNQMLIWIPNCNVPGIWIAINSMSKEITMIWIRNYLAFRSPLYLDYRNLNVHLLKVHHAIALVLTIQRQNHSRWPPKQSLTFENQI